MFRDEIDYFHAPKVSLEILFSVWSEKVAQCRRGGGPLRNGSQKLGRWPGDAVIAQQRFAEGRRFASRSRNLFIAGGAKRVADFINQLWIVRWIDSQRIAHFEAQTPSCQIELEMARILLRLRTAETAINEHVSGKA